MARTGLGYVGPGGVRSTAGAGEREPEAALHLSACLLLACSNNCAGSAAPVLFPTASRPPATSSTPPTHTRARSHTTLLRRLKVLPDTVYMVHINTLPETKYWWHEWTKSVSMPTPVRRREAFRDPHGSAPTRLDLSYKTGKIGDWEHGDFSVARHAKMGFFSSVIGVAAVAAMFR